MKKIYSPSSETGAPFSEAIEANGFVYLSGQIHMGKSGNLEGDSIEEKFEIAMTNASAILERAGLSISDIIRVQLYLTDLTELPKLNAQYMKYFPHPFPVRTTIGVAALPLGASLEVDVVAVRK